MFSSLSKWWRRLNCHAGNRTPIELLEGRKMLSTTFAYGVSSNPDYPDPQEPENYIGTYKMSGITVTTTTLSGDGFLCNFLDSNFPTTWGSGFKWQFTDLPAHSMVRVTTDVTNETNQEDSDTDDLVIKVGSNTYTKTHSTSGTTITGNGGWIASDTGSLTVEVYGENLESGENFLIEGLQLFIYLPTVSVTASASSQSEDDDTPIDFVVSRDLPTGYNATYHDAIPNTTVNVTRGGTATYTDDYTGNLPTSTTTLTGITANTFSAVPVWDHVADDNETVVLSAGSGTGYNLSGVFSQTVTFGNKSGVDRLEYSNNALPGTSPANRVNVANDFIAIEALDALDNTVGGITTWTFVVTPAAGGAAITTLGVTTVMQGNVHKLQFAPGATPAGAYNITITIRNDNSVAPLIVYVQV